MTRHDTTSAEHINVNKTSKLTFYQTGSRCMVKIVDIQATQDVHQKCTYNVTVSEAGWRGEGTHGQAAACLRSLCATHSGLWRASRGHKSRKQAWCFMWHAERWGMTEDWTGSHCTFRVPTSLLVFAAFISFIFSVI